MIFVLKRLLIRLESASFLECTVQLLSVCWAISELESPWSYLSCALRGRYHQLLVNPFTCLRCESPQCKMNAWICKHFKLAYEKGLLSGDYQNVRHASLHNTFYFPRFSGQYVQPFPRDSHVLSQPTPLKLSRKGFFISPAEQRGCPVERLSFLAIVKKFSKTSPAANQIRLSEIIETDKVSVYGLKDEKI